MTRSFLGSTIFFLACVALTAAGVPQAWAAGQYDLAITSFSVNPTQGTVNTKFTYYVTIQNVGNTPAPLKGLSFVRNNDVTQSSGTQPWGSQPTTLSPGQSQQYSLNYVFGTGTATGSGTMPPGRQIIKATINGFYLADDLNPDNNSLYVQAEVANPDGKPLGWPDLQIKGIKTTCGGMVASGLNREVNAGSTVKVTAWTLENIGSQPVFLPKGLLLLRATEKGQPVGEYVVNTSHIMKAGEGFLYDLEIPGSKLTKAGPHEILVSADPSKAVQESSDFNNDYGFFITVKGPDLAVTGVTASPAKPDTRQSIALSVTVKNLSTGQAAYLPQGPVFLTYGPQGKTYQTGAPANFTLAAGQEYRTTLTVPPFTSSPGTYPFTIVVDATGDPNPANNTFTLPVTLTYPPASSLSSPGGTVSSPGASGAPAAPSKPGQSLKVPGSSIPVTTPPKVTTPGGIR